MAENGYGAGAVAGHCGRIPNYGKTQVNPMGSVEPPACIQNAMMTKDKKPFTYTPGGLDLSQIRTPSMARRLARQRSQEEHEQAYGHQQPAYGQHPNNAHYQPQGQGVPAPPPPPPAGPAPPPPPPLLIQAPNAKQAKPIVPGERPEIVIPENPIGMLRKTNSPYHWEAEKENMQKMGDIPKFVEKIPSPLTVKMPTSFSQQPPQVYAQNNQRPNNSYQNKPESPLYRPEAQYANSPTINGTPTRDILQRQDSQFNKSPQPFSGQSPVSNGSPYSPSPNNNWRQPERRDSPAQNSPQSPLSNRTQFSPNVQQNSPVYQNQPPVNNQSGFHTLPRVAQRIPETFANNAQPTINNQLYNNVRDTREESPKTDSSTPWKTNTLSRPQKEPDNLQNIYHNSKNINQQPTYNPPWKSNDANNNKIEPNYAPSYNKPVIQQTTQQQYNPPWVQDSNNNRVQEPVAPWRGQNNRTAPVSQPPRQSPPQEQRFQSSMSIPVTPRKPNPQQEFNQRPTSPQREAVYVNQEPVYYCAPDSPPWVKTQKEKTKTPPPAWCQKPLEGRRSAPRELTTPPRDQEPEWVKKSNEMQRNVRDVISPPKYQQPVQPSWSTRPSDNRKSLPKDTPPQGNRVIPVQMEYSGANGDQKQNQPQLRITVDMTPNTNVQSRIQAPYSQPTQRIMRVLSPQLVRFDDGPPQPELPSLSRTLPTNQDSQPKTRIIPIQIEGGSGGANHSFGGRY